MTERPTILRAAPAPRLKEIPNDEAIDLAKAAFYAARRAQLGLLAQPLNWMLFDPATVTYRRLRGLRHQAREQVETAQRVEQLIGDAVEAFEATRTPTTPTPAEWHQLECGCRIGTRTADGEPLPRWEAELLHTHAPATTPAAEPERDHD